MWPKALMQLLELAPHVSRLVPMADRYLQARADSRDSPSDVPDTMADVLRAELKRLADNQANGQNEIESQTKLIQNLTEDLTAARLANVVIDERLQKIEARLSRIGIWLMAACVLTSAALTVASIAILRLRH